MEGSDSRFKVTGYILGCVYLLILIGGAIFGARQALSQYYSQLAIDSGSDSVARDAIRLLAENPYAHEARGIINLQTGDYAAAAESFNVALALRPNDYLLWMRLGEAEQKMGNIDGARSAFDKAIDLAPNYSGPHLATGRMYLAAGNTAEGFQHLSMAARFDPGLYPELFQSAQIAFGEDPNAIERAVQVDGVHGRTALARYLIDHYWMTEGVRAFLTRGELTREQKDAFVRDLISKGAFEIARDVWASEVGAGVFESPIVDGGFERITEPDPSGLGWQIDQKMSDVQVSRDLTDVHSGEGALNVRFSGKVELQHSILSQLAYVLPRRQYSLIFFVRAKDMLSAGLPAIVVSNATTHSTISQSKPLTDTAGTWVRYEIPFTAPDSPVVLISLQRPSCSTSPCPVFGDLSLDDMSIAEAD